MKKDLKNGVEQTERIIADLSEKIRSGELPQGAKLDSEANLMQQYQTNVYCVRKALRQLKLCGIIYSVPKFGFFVGNDENEKQFLNMVHENFSVCFELNVHVRSYLPLQQKIWNYAGEQCKQEHAIKLKYTFSAKDPENDSFDIIETRNDAYLDHDDKLMDLYHYLPETFLYPPSENNPCRLPVHRVCPLLICNEDRMQELGIPFPAYRNFAEQTDYLRNAMKIIRANGLKLPGTAQGIIFHLPANLPQ